MGRYLRKAVVLLFGVVVGLAAAEAVLRVVFPYRFLYRFPEVIFDGEAPGDNYVADELLGPAWRLTGGPEVFVLRPDMRARLASSEFDTRLETDDRGCRVTPAKADERTAILGVGDSFMQGFGVEAGETFIARIAGALGPSVGAVNGGVMGYRAVNSLERLRTLLPVVKPAAVVFEVWVGNDFCGGAGPSRLPTRGEESAFGAFRRTALRSHLLRFGIDRLRSSDGARRFLMTHGVLGRFGFDRWLTSDFDDRCTEGLDAVTRTAAEAAGLAREAGAGFVFTIMPLREQVNREALEAGARYNLLPGSPEALDLDAPDRALRKRVEAEGLVCVDLTEALREHASKDGFFRGYDVHLTPTGHRVAAEALTPAVRAVLPGS